MLDWNQPSPSHEVRISRKGADRFRSGHPWIFRSDLVDDGQATPGRDRPRARSARPVPGTGPLQRGIPDCIANAQPVGRPDRYRGQDSGRASVSAKQVVTDSTAYRLVHAEADFLPALIVDRYGDSFAIQALDQGMDRSTPEIVAALNAQFSPVAIVARNDAAVRSLEELPRETKVLAGEIDGPVAIRMNGFQMEADLLTGQKTGVFLDQRENYLAAARYATGKSARLLYFHGRFALHLSRTCEQVEAVDSSAAALAAAERNAAANGISNVTFREADVFDVLSSYASARRNFDAIVLDPPAFAKSRKQIDGAMRGYKDINLRALRLLGPGGILVTCSCSHHVSEAMLLEIVAEASLDSGRTLRVLERRTQAQDHPILLTVPETLYLKCLILQVA